MSYCLNPDCQNPQNPDGTNFCLNCGSKLLLKDQYRAIKPIGEGGFGRTFLAEDAYRLNASCVIKQFFPLPQVQGNTEAMEKATKLFEQEARQLLELGEQHPQIPTLFAYFEQDKRLHLVQQFIDGQDLSQELQQHGAFSEQKIRDMLHDLLPVLQFIHEHQVIHRDIKPSNILRRKADSKLILIDFGVAKQLTSTGATVTSTKPGTEGYAPIEQLRGSRAFPASDLYSLGVTCVYLLTQVKLDVLYNSLQGKWVWRPHLQQRGLDVSDQLSQVLDKLLKDFVNQRYQSASEVLRDLNAKAIATPLPPVTEIPKDTDITRIPPPPTDLPRDPNITRIPPPPTDLPRNPNLTRIPLPPTDLPRDPNLTRIPLPPTDLPRDPNLTRIPLPPTAIQRDTNITRFPTSIPSKTWRSVHTLTGHSGAVRSVAISPDGQTLASGSGDKTIKLWDLDSGRLIHTLAEHSNWVRCVAFSADGQTLASCSADKTIKLWQASSGKPISTLTGHSNGVTSVAISPNGKILASGSDDGNLKLWELASGKLIHTFTGHSGCVLSVAFSPDGKTLVSGCGDQIVRLWDLRSGKLIDKLTGHTGWVRSVAFSIDGRTLVSGSEDNTIMVWSLGDRKLIRTLTAHVNRVTSIAIDPDGPTLASVSGDKTIKLWGLDSGKLLQVLRVHSDSIWSVAFSADGQTMASGSGDNSIHICRCD